MKVRIKRVATLALPRNNNDQALPGHSAEFRQGGTEVKDMFENMRANDGVELIVGEWKCLYFCRNQIDALVRPGRSEHEIDSEQSLQFAAPLGSDSVEKQPGTATDIAH